MHMSYTTQVGLGSKRHDLSPVHTPLSNGIRFMGIYAEYVFMLNMISISHLGNEMYGRFYCCFQSNCPSFMAGSYSEHRYLCSEPVKTFQF